MRSTSALTPITTRYATRHPDPDATMSACGAVAKTARAQTRVGTEPICASDAPICASDAPICAIDAPICVVDAPICASGIDNTPYCGLRAICVSFVLDLM